jgi:hypothetical protein
LPQTDPNGAIVNAQFEATDATCADKASSSVGASGTIQLDSVSPTMVTGTFDLTFGNGDHLTGQFAAPVCDFDLAAFRQYGLTGCSSSDGGR